MIDSDSSSDIELSVRHLEDKFLSFLDSLDVKTATPNLVDDLCEKLLEILEVDIRELTAVTVQRIKLEIVSKLTRDTAIVRWNAAHNSLDSAIFQVTYVDLCHEIVTRKNKKVNSLAQEEAKVVIDAKKKFLASVQPPITAVSPGSPPEDAPQVDATTLPDGEILRATAPGELRPSIGIPQADLQLSRPPDLEGRRSLMPPQVHEGQLPSLSAGDLAIPQQSAIDELGLSDLQQEEPMLPPPEVQQPFTPGDSGRRDRGPLTGESDASHLRGVDDSGRPDGRVQLPSVPAESNVPQLGVFEDFGRPDREFQLPPGLINAVSGELRDSIRPDQGELSAHFLRPVFPDAQQPSISAGDFSAPRPAVEGLTDSRRPDTDGRPAQLPPLSTSDFHLPQLAELQARTSYAVSPSQPVVLSNAPSPEIVVPQQDLDCRRTPPEPAASPDILPVQVSTPAPLPLPSPQPDTPTPDLGQLPSLSPTGAAAQPQGRRRPGSRLIIDPVICIRNYAQRAVELGRRRESGNQSRFDVNVLLRKRYQAVMGAASLFSAPRSGSSLFKDNRARVLTRMYKRHLVTEEETLPVPARTGSWVAPPLVNLDVVLAPPAQNPPVNVPEALLNELTTTIEENLVRFRRTDPACLATVPDEPPPQANDSFLMPATLRPVSPVNVTAVPKTQEPIPTTSTAVQQTQAPSPAAISSVTAAKPTQKPDSTPVATTSTTTAQPIQQPTEISPAQPPTSRAVIPEAQTVTTPEAIATTSDKQADLHPPPETPFFVPSRELLHFPLSSTLMPTSADRSNLPNFADISEVPAAVSLPSATEVTAAPPQNVPTAAETPALAPLTDQDAAAAAVHKATDLPTLPSLMDDNLPAATVHRGPVLPALPPLADEIIPAASSFTAPVLPPISIENLPAADVPRDIVQAESAAPPPTAPELRPTSRRRSVSTPEEREDSEFTPTFYEPPRRELNSGPIILDELKNYPRSGFSRKIPMTHFLGDAPSKADQFALLATLLRLNKKGKVMFVETMSN